MDDMNDAAPATPAEQVTSAPAEQGMSVRAYAEKAGLKHWQVVLLRERIGLDKVMPPTDIEKALDAISKERI